MANTVNLRTLIDGPKTVVIHGYVASDGAAGELSDQVVVDASALSPVPTNVTIERVFGHLVGFTGTLEFEATADVPFMTLPDGESFDFCLEEFGGLKDNSGAGASGDVVLTTTGFSAAGDAGWFVIVARKTV
jgi:hypothetical protein